MSNLMTEIDQRTQLAGTNKMELLLFSLGTEEIYGISVFKIREVMKLPAVTKIPDSDHRIIGIVNLRGENIPLVDLKLSIGLGPLDNENLKLLITEYNDNKQGFLVASVDRIVRVSWDRVKVPPAMVRTNGQGVVTAVTQLDDGRMVLILDVEKVLAEILVKSDEELYGGIEVTPLTKGKHVLIADDSLVARKQLSKALDRMGMTYEEATTGKEAWERMQAIAEQAAREDRDVQELVAMILTDIEMPEMDGFTFTKHVRADPRFGNIPILMHSSLSGTCNVEHGKNVGVTDYVSKFDARHLREVVTRVFEAEANKAVSA
ncbi:MAG: chemotaxis protein CheV [Nitrospinae bacterium]|nr:chemotaxis protein CheV [Nitrospinota bacterium]